MVGKCNDNDWGTGDRGRVRKKGRGDEQIIKAERSRNSGQRVSKKAAGRC